MAASSFPASGDSKRSALSPATSVSGRYLRGAVNGVSGTRAHKTPSGKSVRASVPQLRVLQVLQPRASPKAADSIHVAVLDLTGRGLTRHGLLPAVLSGSALGEVRREPVVNGREWVLTWNAQDGARARTDEIERYRLAAERALEQLDWVVTYLRRIRKDRIARAIDQNRQSIRQDMRRTTDSRLMVDQRLPCGVRLMWVERALPAPRACESLLLAQRTAPPHPLPGSCLELPLRRAPSVPHNRA
jgi:hypothetical protein